MKRIFLFFYIYFLTRAVRAQLKHPHEINLNNEDLMQQIQKIEDSRKSNADTVPYYHRLVKYLFRKERFKVDPRYDDYFIANIPLKISRQQYKLLVESDIYGLNINEIDGMIEEVFKQSKSDDLQYSITSILYEHYRQEIIDSVTSFSSPVLWVICSLLAIVILNKLFHFSKLKFITIIFTSIIMICGISYYMTYTECLHDLEVEQIMQLSKEKSENNPCKQYHSESKDFWSSMQTWFIGSKKNECKEYMKRTLGPSAKYCNPLEVFFKWLAKLQMSYFGYVFKEFTEFFAESTSSMNFASRFFSNILLLLFFGISTIFFIVMFLKYVVQTVPSFISHYSLSRNNHIQNTSIDVLSAKMDAILKENVEIKREISVIRERSEEPQPLPSPKKKFKLSAIKEHNNLSKSQESTDSAEHL